MNRTQRIEKYLPLLPPQLKQIFDAELAAGNELNDVEVGQGKDEGKVAVVLDHPFRTKQSPPPIGVAYREFTNRDPMVFEFYTADERFTLVTAKFKPMVLEKLPQGPISPPNNTALAMERYGQEEAARAKRAAATPPPTPPSEPVVPSPAGTKFLESMKITYEMWHDGTGYDLDALKQLSPSERNAIEITLINHHPRDWRDIEALAQIDSPKARAAVEAGLKSSDIQVRQTAMDYAAEKIDPADRETRLLKSLQSDDLFAGLSQAIDEAAEFHPPSVIDCLLKGTLNRPDKVAVNFAALLFFIHGQAPEPFDWNQRPFFLRFATPDRTERKKAFTELCEKLGIDPTKYTQ
jgi:hypothetical protein